MLTDKERESRHSFAEAEYERHLVAQAMREAMLNIRLNAMAQRKQPKTEKSKLKVVRKRA